MENYTKLKMIFNLLGGDGDKVVADTKARMQEADNGGMSRETAIALRDALGDYGTVCIYNGCDDLAFSGEQVAVNYNARHPETPIDTHYAGYVAFEI